MKEQDTVIRAQGVITEAARDYRQRENHIRKMSHLPQPVCAFTYTYTHTTHAHTQHMHTHTSKDASPLHVCRYI